LRISRQDEDERGGGASVISAAQKLGLTASTIDAV